ncbi:MAG: hypothetical protein QOG80_593 [Pseudonocardiales bacterium]|jgi:SAM-dependent methyltransferase|nr:hypothetical protein [Pseudonocardiales bacterium]
MRRLSKKAFNGWATTHRPRWWEYPWIVREVRRRGGGGKAADFGAGQSPVPLALAELGYETFVVDPDTLEGKYDNEWNFVDYGRWGITTIRAGMEDAVFEPGTLDVAVSVSVIEHLPADARRRGLQQIYTALKPGGLAVLSVDVLPDGIHLWNRVEDEIESLDVHGTVDDFMNECEAVGFSILQRSACPITVPHLRVQAAALVRP